MPATTTRTLFARETAVSIDINAPAERVWRLLTDAGGYTKWNSTIVSLEGEIAESGRLALVSTLDPKRTFKLRVKAFEPTKRLAWGDAMGTRTCTLTPRAGGVTNFQMVERIGGPLFPLFARMIPPFDAAFDQFAGDLKRAAEGGNG
jgi:uncharacterized protein YndB with AHSA1/START domain